MELGLEYTSIEDRSLLRSDELKKIHPLGKMPAAIINGMALFESSAICNYIADQTKDIDLIAKPGTWSRAQHDQWTYFNLTELEAWIELLSKVVFELKIKRQSGFQESPRFHQRIVHLQSPLPGNQSHVTFSNSFLHIVPA